MSKPSLFANLIVILDPNAKGIDKSKFIQVFKNNVKRGFEFSFSIDKLTTDPAKKMEVFKKINAELGQYFPNGAIPDKDEKFRFYADNKSVWYDNQLGSKIQDILTNQFGNAQAIANLASSAPAPAQTPQPSSGIQEFELPKSEVKIKVDGKEVKFQVGTAQCNSNFLREEIVKLLQSISYVEKDTTNSNELYYSTSFTCTLTDLGLSRLTSFNGILDDYLSKLDVAVGKLWCIEVGDYFIAANGVIVRVESIDASNKSPYQLKIYNYLPQLGLQSTTWGVSKDELFDTIRSGSFLSFQFILDGDEFYVTEEDKDGNKKLNQIKVTNVNGLDITFIDYPSEVVHTDQEKSFKAMLWTSGYHFKRKESAPLVIERGGYYIDSLGIVFQVIAVPSRSETSIKIKFYETNPDGSYREVNNVINVDDFNNRLNDGTIKPLYLPNTDKNLFNVTSGDIFRRYTGKLKYEIKIINKFNQSTGNKPGDFSDVKVEIEEERINGNNFVDSFSSNNADFAYILYSRGYRKVITLDFSEGKSQKSSLTDIPASDEEMQIEQLNKDIAQLMFFRSILSPIDFEKKIDFSQQIQAKQKEVNKLNFYILEKKLKSQNIFEELFEQSFTPLNNAYDGVYAKSPDETDFFAPDGTKSKLSDALNELIRTPQFKDWFGEWELAYMYRDTDAIEIECSKVINKHYEPLVVWHGTGQEFSYFRFDKFPAAYFAVNQQYSQFFADLHGGDEGYVIPFFLNIRNPLDLTHFETNDIPVKDFFDYIFLQTGLDMDALGVNPLFLDPSVEPMQTWIYIRNNPNMLQKLAELNMYDGIHFYETNPSVKDTSSPAYKTEAFITFNPNQSKIADPNRGLILLASMKSFLLEKGGKI
jgi:hypothetical protein